MIISKLHCNSIKLATALLLLNGFIFLSACSRIATIDSANDTPNDTNIEQLTVTSPVFENASMIPKAYTCDGQEQLFPVLWSKVPDNTQSIAVLIEDPDAPFGTYTHLLAWNIPPSVNKLTAETRALTFGLNSAGKPEYKGPCPPFGTHHYFIKLFALDIPNLGNEAHEKKWFLEAVNNHVIAKGELMGTYKRQK